MQALSPEEAAPLVARMFATVSEQLPFLHKVWSHDRKPEFVDPIVLLIVDTEGADAVCLALEEAISTFGDMGTEGLAQLRGKARIENGFWVYVMGLDVEFPVEVHSYEKEQLGLTASQALSPGGSA